VKRNIDSYRSGNFNKYSTAIMVNHHIVLIALLATLCGQFITVQAQGNTDGNRQYFVDYLEFVKAGLGRKGERSPAFQRYKGTYWDATKVLNVADAVQKPADTAEWPGECGVAFYFDDMPRRLKSIQNKKAAAQTFAKPLAIAPVCEGGVKPETDGQYPISSSQGNSVVFEQYRPAPKGGAKNDAYFILQCVSLLIQGGCGILFTMLADDLQECEQCGRRLSSTRGFSKPAVAVP
jgi:hypothetical protein